jgi:sec-independent protein translocase protein TatA
MNLGASEILLLLIVVLLLFGGKRLPELARSIGKGLAEFRRATQEVQRELNAPLINQLPAPKPAESANESSASESLKVNVHPDSQPRTTEGTPGSAS